MGWDTPSAFNQQQSFIPQLQQPQQLPVGKATVPNPDLEDAHHRLNDLIWSLLNKETLSRRDLQDTITTLYDIESLVYRSLK